jgi:hypothetical protein
MKTHRRAQMRTENLSSGWARSRCDGMHGPTRACCRCRLCPSSCTGVCHIINAHISHHQCTCSTSSIDAVTSSRWRLCLRWCTSVCHMINVQCHIINVQCHIIDSYVNHPCACVRDGALMYACMHACTYTYIHDTYVHACMHTYIHTHMHAQHTDERIAMAAQL